MDAMVLLEGDDPDTGIRSGPLPEDLRAPVRGAVVDAQDLQVPERLPLDGIQAALQILLRVVHGNGDRNPDRLFHDFPYGSNAFPPRNTRRMNGVW